MAITRQQKEAQVANLKEEFSKSSMNVLASYSGLSVQAAQDLRKDLKQQGGNFRIVKNAMLKQALEETFEGSDFSDLEGPIAVAFGYDDQVIPAKAVMEFGKKYGSLEPLTAVNAYGERFDAAQVKQLAELPSREELTAQLVGTIAAPLSGFVRVLNGNIRGLVTALDGVAQQKASES